MAKKKFLVNIDLNLNQLINSRAENGMGFTTGGINSKGRLMYDTSTNRVLYDTGITIETIANLNDVAGLLDFKGGYNALTNTPNLINPPSGTINKGDYYIVTVAGTFYGTLLEIGDSLFASVDNPTTIDGWVIVQANVVYATETIAGIILLATQEEVNTGTNNSKAITPLTLATYVTNNKQNIYNIDGTLTANRTITLADKNLTFTGVGNNIFQFNINNGVQYSQTSLNANLINSSIYNTTLQLNSATTVQNGVVSLKVYNDVLTVDRSLIVNSFGTRINSSYYLPNTDGTAGQVVITDGAGNLSFGNAVLGSGATNSLAFWSSTSTISFDVLLRRGTSGGNAFIQVLGTDADVTIGNGVASSGVDIRSNLNGISAIYSYGFGSSVLSFQRSRGTKSAPTEALSGDTIGNIVFNNVGVVQVKSTENNSSGWGNTVKFYTGVQGTTTQQEVLRLTTDKKVKISNAFFLPNTDGTAGQLMITDGAGNVSWGSSSSVNIYNTNGTLTANRILTFADKNLTFTGNGGQVTIFQYDPISEDGASISQTLTQNLIQVSNGSSALLSQVVVGQFNIANTVSNDTNSTSINQTNSFVETQILDTFNTNVAFRIIIGASGLNINNAYTLPKVDGTAFQVLGTNGSGVVTWQNVATPSPINIYNTDGQLTANRNLDGNAKTLDIYNVSSFTVSVVPLPVAIFGYQINVNSTGMSGSIGTRIFNIIDSNGTLERFGITKSGNVKINDAFILPLSDGTAGQVLTTNGAGVTSWGTSSSTNIYNTNGTLTANRTITIANFNLIFSGIGTSGSTQFTRSNGGATQSSITTTYNSLSLNSSNGTDISSFSTTPTQNFANVSDLSDNSTQIQQLSTEIRLLVQDSVGVLNSLTVKNNGININSAYTLPKTAGTSGQILVIDGAGNVNWTSSGIGTSDIWKSNPNETYRGVSFNNNSTTVITDGGVTLSVSASVLAQSVSSTNFATKQIRLRYYASVVSAGRYTGLRGTALLWFMQGGFRYVCDFNISDTAYSSGTQQFYGMASSTADLNYGTVSGFLVSSLINIIGVGNDTGDANLQIFHNDGTGTATKIDLGASFPANRTSLAISTTVYEIQLINLPATLTVQYRVINKETGAIATGTLATNLPDATLGLNFFASRCMATLSSITNSGQFD
ncbi:MAG: hypothetical protein JHC39_11560, partial [Lentimicrobium sp.]|nr:hypothetical protein [Lentimicrobium sp.]